MVKNIFISIRLLIVMILLTGFIYPLSITFISQLAFNNKANGSLLLANDTIIGSRLIGQKFSSDKYFWSRPSASDYKTIPSGASNLSYTSSDLKSIIELRKKTLKFFSSDTIPEDLLFASASGIDPHISPKAARFQVDRIAAARNFNADQKEKLKKLIEKLIEKRQFGIFGEERINVLLLNLELDKLK